MIYLSNRITNYFKRFSKNEDLKLPEYIYIAVNNKCNLNCRMCDVGTNTDSQFRRNMIKDKELDINVLYRLVDDVSFYKPYVAITSTEPLLYSKLFEFINYVKYNNMKVQLTTNGLLMPKKIHNIVSSGVDDIWFSVDGTEKIHNEIRGNKHSHQRIIESLKQLESQDLKININITISDKNYLDIYNCVNELSNFKISSICISHTNFVTKEMSDKHNKTFGNIVKSTPSCISHINLDNIDVDMLEEQCSTIERDFKNVSFSPRLSGREYYIYYRKPLEYIGKLDKCTIPWRSAQIFCNGDVGVSTRCFDISFGNIYDKSFIDIWDCDKFNDFRRSLKRFSSFPACTRCCGVFSS